MNERNEYKREKIDIRNAPEALDAINSIINVAESNGIRHTAEVHIEWRKVNGVERCILIVSESRRKLWTKEEVLMG